MSDLKGVAVVSFSLIFGFMEFRSVPCHPRDRKQQDFIPLEMRRLSGASWRRMRKGMPVLSVENFYLSLKSSSELYRTRQGCSSLFWVKAQETCESFLLAFLQKVCCELYILKSQFPDGFRQMNFVMQGISFFLIAPLLASCPHVCGLVDVAFVGELPLKLNERSLWQSQLQQDAEDRGVGCDFFSCSIEKSLCCILLFWLF